jgi:predicted nucleotidyltransferase
MRISTVTVKSLQPLMKELAILLRPVAREAYLFGSAAAGAAVRYESDVDVLVIPAHKTSVDALYKRLDPLVGKFLSEGLVLHVILYDPARYSRDFLAEVKKGIKIV